MALPATAVLVRAAAAAILAAAAAFVRLGSLAHGDAVGSWRSHVYYDLRDGNLSRRDYFVVREYYLVCVREAFLVLIASM